MQETKLIVIAAFGNRLEAQLAKGALDAAGIDSMLRGDTVGKMREHIAWSGSGFQLLVREEDAEEARRILKDAGELSE